MGHSLQGVPLHFTPFTDTLSARIHKFEWGSVANPIRIRPGGPCPYGVENPIWTYECEPLARASPATQPGFFVLVLVLSKPFAPLRVNSRAACTELFASLRINSAKCTSLS